MSHLGLFGLAVLRCLTEDFPAGMRGGPARLAREFFLFFRCSFAPGERAWMHPLFFEWLGRESGIRAAEHPSNGKWSQVDPLLLRREFVSARNEGWFGTRRSPSSTWLGSPKEQPKKGSLPHPPWYGNWHPPKYESLNKNELTG